MKRIGFGVLAVGLLIGLTGCETGRNYQSETDALNSKMSALQSQLALKDDEISKLKAQEGHLATKDTEIADLKRQAAQQQEAIARADNERKLLAQKLDEALVKLAQKQKAARADSDLK